MIESCTCTSQVVRRSQPEWTPGRDLYGYGVSIIVRIHFGTCPCRDEVLMADCIGCVTFCEANPTHHPDCRLARALGGNPV